jgi:hypothetical protein
MTKLLLVSFLLVLGVLFIGVKPASAACVTQKIVGPGYVYMKNVCSGIQPVNNNVTVMSMNGTASSTIITVANVNTTKIVIPNQ